MIYDSTIYQTWLYRVIMEQMTISEKFLPHIQWQYHGILYVTNSDIWVCLKKGMTPQCFFVFRYEADDNP
jgi:hypothetical protein